MNIPEKLLKLSEKELKKILIPNIYKAKYIVKENKILEIDSKHKGFTYLAGKGGRIDYASLLSNYTPLSYEALQKFKVNNVFEKCEKWEDSKFQKWCESQFIDVYGEEFVSIDDHAVTVHFPEIIIKNSCEQEHLMHDIYLSFYIDCDSVRLSGLLRGTLTDVEIRNRYMFSHVLTEGNVFAWATEFCFGSTEISDLKRKLRSGRKVDVLRNLKFFLEALKEYLSWESLEGVPYNKIDNVICDKNKWREAYSLNYHREEIYKELIQHISDFTYTYSYISGQYNLELTKESINEIEELLTTIFPDLCQYSLNGRSVRKTAAEECLYKNDHHIFFKGEYRPFTLIATDDSVAELPKKINNLLLRDMIFIIEQKFTTFLTQRKINEYIKD